jgi:hypothetical protein
MLKVLCVKHSVKIFHLIDILFFWSSFIHKMVIELVVSITGGVELCWVKWGSGSVVLGVSGVTKTKNKKAS